MHPLADATAAPSTTDPRLTLPTRAELRDRLVAILRGAGVDWAWQGATGAHDRWLVESGPADLDIWWRPGSGSSDPDPAALVERLCRELPAAPVADAHDPARLRHTSLVVRADSGLAIIDLTHGDLRVGPIELLPAALVTCTAGDTPRLMGVAAAADLLVRPVLRGRVPVGTRVGEAREAWADASAVDRAAVVDLWSRGLGAAVAAGLLAVLRGAEPTPTLVSLARRRLIRATLAPRALPSTWRQRRTITPAGRHASPLGLRGHGVVVALVGTDGSGKSTVAAQVRERLEDAGFSTSAAYFGMARGNLPGVALARKVLGVGGVQPPASTPSPAAAALAEGAPPSSAPAAEAVGLDRPLLRRAAAWYYAAEYIWRYQRTVAPQRRRGSIVLVDRYVYDLRESPWPGSMASRVAEALVPRPDILVLPDAPDDMIHARKPERSAHEQAAIQARYRSLLAERPARFGHVVVDTSGSTPTPWQGWSWSSSRRHI